MELRPVLARFAWIPQESLDLSRVHLKLTWNPAKLVFLLIWTKTSSWNPSPKRPKSDFHIRIRESNMMLHASLLPQYLATLLSLPAPASRSATTCSLRSPGLNNGYVFGPKLNFKVHVSCRPWWVSNKLIQCQSALIAAESGESSVALAVPFLDWSCFVRVDFWYRSAKIKIDPILVQRLI